MNLGPTNLSRSWETPRCNTTQDIIPILAKNEGQLFQKNENSNQNLCGWIAAHVPPRAEGAHNKVAKTGMNWLAQRALLRRMSSCFSSLTKP